MEVKLLSERENPLFHRKELQFEINHPSTATPSTKDVRAKLAAKLTVNEELLVVKNCRTAYGGTTTRGHAYVYKTKEAMKVELPQFIKRNFPSKEEAKPAEEKPAEQKTEAKPEEKKAKEKKEPEKKEESK